ncbi:MAG: ATP-binding cassette domain-containing protein, partial [Byssovorax sp.]
MTTTTQKAEAPVLEVTRLGKHFSVGGGFFGKRLRALHDVSFTIRRREVVALVGESGSGKSTIARLLARLMPPSEGKILFKGRDVLAEEPRGASLAYRR